MSQNRNCSLSTLFLRLSAGFLLTISMSIHAIIAINAPVSRLVITTHGRMSKITRRSFTSCLHRQGILAPVVGLASRLVELFTSVFCWYRGGCLLFTFPPLLVIHAWFEAGYSCVLHFFRLLSLSFPRHANIENYKILLLNKTNLPSTESTLLSSAW